MIARLQPEERQRTRHAKRLRLKSPNPTSQTVINCYDFFDRIFPECGLIDFTDGMYLGDDTTNYEQAQENQANWLLDQVACTRGTRLLDIGCGNGRLVEMAGRRGACVTGITVSPAQVKRCRERGLDVRLLNYRNLPTEWSGQFDAVVANGSIEHFVSTDDVQSDSQDFRYRELFYIVDQLLAGTSPSARFATTVIHTNQQSPQIDKADYQRRAWTFPWFSEKFHFALLQQGFGGYYPAPGQLQRCASEWFELVAAVDGTHDYHLTSEQWFSKVKRSLFHPFHAPKLVKRLSGFLAKYPRQGLDLLVCLLIAESWQRQFRGQHPPTTLFRHVWQKKR